MDSTASSCDSLSGSFPWSEHVWSVHRAGCKSLDVHFCLQLPEGLLTSDGSEQVDKELSSAPSPCYYYFSFGIQDLHCSMWDLVPWLGIEPRSPVLVLQSRSHWATREAPFIIKKVFFGPCQVACGILVPWPGTEPLPPALGGRGLNRWTTRDVPRVILFRINFSHDTWSLGKNSVGEWASWLPASPIPESLPSAPSPWAPSTEGGQSLSLSLQFEISHRTCFDEYSGSQSVARGSRRPL